MKEGTPRGMRDRFAGKSKVAVTRERHWDTGAKKGHSGAEVAPYKGTTGQVKDAAKLSQSRVERPGRPSNPDGGQVVGVGYPMTGGPHMSLGRGHGPKVATRKARGGGMKSGNPQHGAKTGGTDKGPPSMTGTGSGFARGGKLGKGRMGRRPKMIKK